MTQSARYVVSFILSTPLTIMHPKALDAYFPVLRLFYMVLKL